MNVMKNSEMDINFWWHSILFLIYTFKSFSYNLLGYDFFSQLYLMDYKIFFLNIREYLLSLSLISSLHINTKLYIATFNARSFLASSFT